MIHFTPKQLRATHAGLDYLRLTSSVPGMQRLMRKYFLQVAARDLKLGYEIRRGGALGFLGDVCRHALYGERKEWAMLQVSGYEAQQGLILASNANQATRVDIQVTYKVTGTSVPHLLDTAYHAACDHVRPKSRPIAVTRIENRHRTQTVYLGKRSSDVFCRIYDKFEESGKEEYRGCVRFELELKGRLARATWKYISESGQGPRWCLNLLAEIFRERGIDLPMEDIGEVLVAVPPVEKSLVDNKIGWLAKQVSPTVSAISATHGWILAFSVLFETALTEDDKRRIMSLLSRVWGN